MKKFKQLLWDSKLWSREEINNGVRVYNKTMVRFNQEVIKDVEPILRLSQDEDIAYGYEKEFKTTRLYIHTLKNEKWRQPKDFDEFKMHVYVIHSLMGTRILEKWEETLSKCKGTNLESYCRAQLDIYNTIIKNLKDFDNNYLTK